MVELVFDAIAGTQANRTIAFLHGILGRGNNLRTIARQFVEARPDYTAWLVDLRGHGRSPKRSANPSIETAARDVLTLGVRAAQPLTAIVGHSLGGKVALEALRIEAGAALEHVVVLDAVPGTREPSGDHDTTLAVVDAIETLPATFRSQAEFVTALLAKGMSQKVAQWLGQSLERDGEHVRFALDLGEIRALLGDYFARDLWPVVENPPGTVRIHLVIADRSDTYSPADRERAAQIAASTDRVTMDILPGGHWIHVDDAAGLLRTLLHRVED